MEKINIVWFKRDLRTEDHKPLQSAIQQGIPILLLYIQEPDLWADDHMDSRHNRCIYQSLIDMNTQLITFNQRVIVLEGNPLSVFQNLHHCYAIDHVFSHQETGLKQTYDRDLMLNDFFIKSSISWMEFQRNGVHRGLKNRDTWRKNWYAHMNHPIDEVDLPQIPNPPKLHDVMEYEWPASITNSNKHIQYLGVKTAHQTMTSFITDRGRHYMQNISKPETSAIHCSRLSPFLVYGISPFDKFFRLRLSKKNSVGNGTCPPLEVDYDGTIILFKNLKWKTA